jgi:hypothetical protein
MPSGVVGAVLAAVGHAPETLGEIQQLAAQLGRLAVLGHASISAATRR